MKAITDASFKRGRRSTHSYTLKTWQGKTIAERNFRGFANTSMEAEINTIEVLLKYCLDKGFEDIKIYTDCKNIVDAVNTGCGNQDEISYLKHLLKATKSKIRWVKRDKVARCDANCKRVGKRKFIKGKLVS